MKWLFLSTPMMTPAAFFAPSVAPRPQQQPMDPNTPLGISNKFYLGNITNDYKQEKLLCVNTCK